MSDDPIETSGRSYIYALSGNRSHLDLIEKALLSFYRVRKFSDASELVDVLQSRMPTAILIDDDLKSGTGLDLIGTLRLSYAGDQLPIVFTLQTGRSQDIANHYSGVKVLEKPYKRTSLLHAISCQSNSSVEAKWDQIEPVQKAALKNTINAFNNVADLISEGKPIEYKDVTASCAPLLEAVKNNNYQDMLKGVRGHDNYSYVHSMRVATLLSLFGAAIGIKGDDHVTLTSGGLLHDVGKMNIPHEVLNKAGRLDENEFCVMKSHVTQTLDFFELSDSLPKGVAVIAGQHHEKIDGTGYPNGVAGKELNQLARMAAIIDVFSALTDRRVYKPSMEPEKALSIMGDMSGHLDQSLMMVFREVLLDSVVEA